ncbi:MAG: PfkB family carbohydrate kinase [Bryobacteraceae bacterium]
MQTALLGDGRPLRYGALLGVGGIGSGAFFRLSGNETFGREESRLGRFLDQRDYCKLHIIAHNVRALLGTAFSVIPLGRVGDDDPGRKLIGEMKQAGLDVRYVEVCPGEQTMYSICVQYPDGAGGNLTTEDSACCRVDAAFVKRALPEFERYRGRGVALAAPETPLESRAALLRLGTEYGFFRAASFNALEVPEAMQMGLFGHLDLLALNRSEAECLMNDDADDPAHLAARAIERLNRDYPNLSVSVTAGPAGAWLWDTRTVHFTPAIPVAVRNTAGAGDAHLAALIAGAVASLETEQAHRLAGLVASYSVTSPHTIHPNLDGASLREFGARSHVGLGL